jgi:hypothetical protein
VLPFLLEVNMRTDQKYHNGKTVLHNLAESGDLHALEIFHDADFQGINFAAIDSKAIQRLSI